MTRRSSTAPAATPHREKRMSRMEINALTSLIGMREAGGYDLPTELVGAYRTVRADPRAGGRRAPRARRGQRCRPRGVTPPRPATNPTSSRRAAISRKRTGTDAPPNAPGPVLAAAVEQAAGTRPPLLAADLTERIITEHLRPRP